MDATVARRAQTLASNTWSRCLLCLSLFASNLDRKQDKRVGVNTRRFSQTCVVVQELALGRIRNVCRAREHHVYAACDTTCEEQASVRVASPQASLRTTSARSLVKQRDIGTNIGGSAACDRKLELMRGVGMRCASNAEFLFGAPCCQVNPKTRQ